MGYSGNLVPADIGPFQPATAVEIVRYSIFFSQSKLYIQVYKPGSVSPFRKRKGINYHLSIQPTHCGYLSVISGKLNYRNLFGFSTSEVFQILLSLTILVGSYPTFSLSPKQKQSFHFGYLVSVALSVTSTFG